MNIPRPIFVWRNYGQPRVELYLYDSSRPSWPVPGEEPLLVIFEQCFIYGTVAILHVLRFQSFLLQYNMPYYPVHYPNPQKTAGLHLALQLSEVYFGLHNIMYKAWFTSGYADFQLSVTENIFGLHLNAPVHTNDYTWLGAQTSRHTLLKTIRPRSNIDYYQIFIG
jgi:hypothetical protein